MIKSVIKELLFLIYPKRCDLCGEVIELNAVRCDSCKNAERPKGKCCKKCGRPEKDCVCSREKFSPKYKEFCAPYYYKDSIVNAVLRLKNSGYTELAPVMADEISAIVKTRFEGISFDVITCVPMTERKVKKRGYNQSELLAKACAERLNVPFEELLIKPKETRAQRFSTAKNRKVNLYGAFSIVNKNSLKDKTVLVVDDVKTTGSTLAECAAVLSADGATVYAAAFCLTDKK